MPHSVSSGGSGSSATFWAAAAWAAAAFFRRLLSMFLLRLVEASISSRLLEYTPQKVPSSTCQTLP